MSLGKLHECDLGTNQRILVIDSGTILDEGVLSLIESRPGMEVSSIQFENESALVKDIALFRPEVVILNRAGPVGPEKIIGLLDIVPTLNKLRLLSFKPGTTRSRSTIESAVHHITGLILWL